MWERAENEGDQLRGYLNIPSIEVLDGDNENRTQKNIERSIDFLKDL